MLDFDYKDEFSDYEVIIKNSKTGDVITGLFDDDQLSYSTSADLSNSTLASSLLDTAKGTIQGFANAFGAGGVAQGIMQNYQNIRSTVKSYGGSGENGFSIQMHVFGIDEPYSTTLEKAMKLTQPLLDDSGTMRSHLYDFKDARDITANVNLFDNQLIHVTIGDWFRATGLFCTGVTYSHSKYVDEEGKNIYMVLNFGFVPYRVLTAEELAAWTRR